MTGDAVAMLRIARKEEMAVGNCMIGGFVDESWIASEEWFWKYVERCGC